MISKNNEIDILEIIQTIWINKKTIILITTLITILGIIYALILTPWYTANIKILPSSKSNNFINRYAGLAAMVGIDIQSESGNEQLIYPEIIK
jgi:LPS O-antigen subunit length determinant protein (WzzB/FepE family)